ncbi:MAG TPA: hypothetical protein VII11_04885, partial [Bacteroidota bacterium]
GLAGITETRISGGFEYLNFTSKDNANTGTYARGEFQGLAFAFPISKEHGASLMLETTPYSTVHYSVERKDTQLGATSLQQFFGTGGLTTLAIGGSYAPWENTVLGLKFNYIFGGIRQVNKIDFEDASYTDSELQRFWYHSGFNFTLGTIYHGFGELLNDPSLKPLSLGFVLTTPATLDMSEESYHVIGTVSDTIKTGANSATIPFAWGAGLSYLFSERYTLSGDLHFQYWKPENFPSQQFVNIRRSARFGIGFEALPSRTANSFLTSIAYRAGIAYHSTYVQIGNEPVDEFLVSGGLGLPVGPASRLNLGLHVGVRGTTDNNLQRDTFVRLSLTLSASEVWFLRFEEE